MKRHFVLVHGLCHGAWCWYKLVTLLERAGHRVTALDLAGCGINLTPMSEIKTLDDYVEPLMALMRSIDACDEDQKVILVGHSFGGIPISLAMEKFPEKILVAVFISAYMPSCSSPPIVFLEETFKRMPIEECLDTSFWHDNGPENGPTSLIMGPHMLTAKLYQNCPLEDVELGKRLVRPCKLFTEELAKEGLFSEGRYGAVDRVYVMCEEDELMNKDFQRWVIRRSPTQHVKSIPKADHMVMLSRPQQLCLSLLEIADMYQPSQIVKEVGSSFCIGGNIFFLASKRKGFKRKTNQPSITK